MGQFGLHGRTQDEIAADEAERLKRENEQEQESKWWNPFGNKDHKVAAPSPLPKDDTSWNPFAHTEHKGIRVSFVCACV